MTDAPWHADPALAGHFHPEHPSDLQVLVHDGEPRRTGRGPEGCWVTVRAVHGALQIPVAPPGAQPPLTRAAVSFVARPVYAGTLLNAPHQLTTARQGDTLLFVTSPGIPHPVRVTEQYIAERSDWTITPCNQCGADQALDPPSIMAQTRFPGAPGVPVAFSAFCPCGGTMLLGYIGETEKQVHGEARAPRKPWWKFW